MFSWSRHSTCCIAILVAVSARLSLTVNADDATPKQIDFNRDIRSILSNKCYQCHGPDEAERQAELRIDTPEGATRDLDGHAAIVPGKPSESELVARSTSGDPDYAMPPHDSGKKLSTREIELLTEWVRQGAAYAKHWSYVVPVRSELPAVDVPGWVRNEIDRFLLARLDREGLKPAPEADRHALIRRVTLDLTGLPPTLEEVEQFINDKSPDAYEQLVDRLLEKKTYGEHWARMWLDLARYADSSGYADDPPRTIWAFRDYVIRSLNANKPFDQFTIEQIAGDLLPEPTEDQLIATAFHRNTLTNNEGGTNDEEFRNVAVVDRVNTTMAVWMGTTIACAQCHNHKFDPITQEEFFKFFAFFNNSEDADRRDESPLIQLFSREQKVNRLNWQHEVEKLKKTLSTPTPALLASLAKWEKGFATEPTWQVLTATKLTAKSGRKLESAEGGTITATGTATADTYTLELPLPAVDDDETITAVQLETLPGENFVVSRVLASLIPPDGSRLDGRYVRIELPGKAKMLSLAEVQVFSGSDNVAVKGSATQSSTGFDGPAKLAIDGNTDGDYQKAKSTTHTAQSDNPWWEVDLKTVQPIDRLLVWNRTDNNLQSRLNGFVVKVLDENRETVFEQTVKEAPKFSAEYSLSSARGIPFVAAYADYSQAGFAPDQVINNPDVKTKGWAVGGAPDKPHRLTLIPKAPVEIPVGSTLSVTIEQLSKFENHTLSSFRINTTADAGIATYATTPADQLAILKTPADQRSDEQTKKLTVYFVGQVALELKTQRDLLAQRTKQLTELKPATSVPVMKEMPKGRVTKIQIRGNFQQTSEEVTAGTPAAFHPLPEGQMANRLALAKWLVDDRNPMTARVIANRYWEAIFGIGIVSTSEEFGSQGDLPFHPELLDWLATEVVASDWNMKKLVKRLVTSAAYRQSSKVTEELQTLDPDNRLLARGPRFRLSAEMIRDQALAVAGLLSPKMYGAPVRPHQPKMGVSAAFGSGIDWTTSTGEDKYRRGLYTTWRRSNPYPSMIAFDATNREVCTVRRDRTNTPLQALVTLNDPVYVEAAQSLSRHIAAHKGSTEEKVQHGFQLCLARPAHATELARLSGLYETVRSLFADSPEAAMQMATMPLGPVPDGMDVTDLAAWTVVGNVLLNLDEMFMKR